MRTLGKVLSMIEGKFKYDDRQERFVCATQGSVMSLEFSGYAHLGNIRSRIAERMMRKGGLK